MQKFVSREKMSKKARREYDLKNRITWGCINPITRTPENPRAYNRKKVQKRVDKELVFEPFYILT